MQIKVSINELSALLKRCFEGRRYLPGDYSDAAATCIWLETHALNGLTLLVDSWPSLKDGASLPSKIRSRTDENIIVDAKGQSLLVSGQKFSELAVSNLQDGGVSRVDIHDCHSQIAIVPGIAAMSQRGYSALAHWQSEGSQYYALATSVDLMPRLMRFELADSDECSPLTLHLICCQSDAEIESALQSIVCPNRHVRPFAITESMLQSFNNSVEYGLAVDLAIWKQLNTAADAVLVKASEQSRHGAGA